MNTENLNVRLVPVLRFPEFKGEWEKKNLGSVAKFSRGKGISKSDISEDGRTECIRYGELYTFYGETIDKVKSRTNVDTKDLVLSEANDVIIPASGETQIDIATASCVLKSDVALGGDLNIIKTANNGVFLSYYLNSKKKLEIASLAQGISVVHLYSSQLSLLDLNLPSLPEQKRIASFFAVLDQKLNQLKQKKNLLAQYKKGIMQQLFSQELRFKADDGNKFPDWQEKKLGEVVHKSSSNIAANAIADNNGDYKVYGASCITKYVDFYREAEAYISIVKDGAGVGRLFLCEPKTSVLGTLDIIKTNGSSLKYLFYLLQQIDFSKYVTGSTIPHIYFSDYKTEKVPVPSLAEQTKIANLLSATDEKINHTQTQIQRTEQYKKGLLQKMFC